jgi:hypothetical protein
LDPDQLLAAQGEESSMAAVTIEIGQEHAPFVVLVYFSSFEHEKNLLIMAPTTLKPHH